MKFLSVATKAIRHPEETWKICSAVHNNGTYGPTHYWWHHARSLMCYCCCCFLCYFKSLFIEFPQICFHFVFIVSFFFVLHSYGASHFKIVYSCWLNKLWNNNGWVRENTHARRREDRRGVISEKSMDKITGHKNPWRCRWWCYSHSYIHNVTKNEAHIPLYSLFIHSFLRSEHVKLILTLTLLLALFLLHMLQSNIEQLFWDERVQIEETILLKGRNNNRYLECQRLTLCFDFLLFSHEIMVSDSNNNNKPIKYSAVLVHRVFISFSSTKVCMQSLHYKHMEKYPHICWNIRM